MLPPIFSIKFDKVNENKNYNSSIGIKTKTVTKLDTGEDRSINSE